MSQLSMDFDAFDHDSFISLLVEHKRIGKADLALAKLLNEQRLDDYLYVFLLLLIAHSRQHSCLALEEINLQDPFELNYLVEDASQALSPFINTTMTVQALLQHPAIGEDKPLRLYGSKLYLARLANYEAKLAGYFETLARAQVTLDEEKLSSLLDFYFPPQQGTDELDWQKVACTLAVVKRFCVITGGPGTGKTTTVTKLLAILQALYARAPLTIKLVAPTGKAAARLSESIIGAKARLTLPSDLAELLPEQAQTVHRLLGVIPNSLHYRHNQDNPLHLDVLIVDEASMVDLSLMAKLVDALPKHARLILLGDKDQLASVDTGNVLSDLCENLTLGQVPNYSHELSTKLTSLSRQALPKGGHEPAQFMLEDNLAFLQKSHRFDSNSGIGQLAYAVNSNNKRKLDAVIKQGFADLQLHELNSDAYNALITRAAAHYKCYLEAINSSQSEAYIHSEFASYQLLAAVREGPYGVNELNRRIELKLAQMGLIQPTGRFYVGMPIMITQNDYQLKLFNGDIGIILRDEQGDLQASFIDEQGNVRRFYPARLPSFDRVYVMTIHKSQGSEFAHTAMILPPIQRAQQGINRQLIYTGITRAKKHFELVAQYKVLLSGMNRTVSRSSGLRERLSFTE
ncbi:exodeoxyribonuclease V subunit alpha [Pseudoalteromonas peptidolytica]|uniref:RecBCD enzyme subunit RecD n=1 Tax=Pseudoalteromonas peptidolytica F12-50-A1 TaxID=1315280 RepID=A0A8I0MU85_9GAMM|nr:exodeoxyribonuclease V subunit alpha [Pseudoalteromonas peptidolytica]MBE0345965.1 exodeoxyribonuclease V alpha subunit [Pseudoalteromonas peptidolytica F12-50-A1]NLR14786.1 exodeoxyribonuclease V subunit alpha [Pseudoalteromonas peptidolytica]GEK10178.1 RecBCD enzyme subunit RecD [Pseudoalteromonas peptidolytica]